MQNKYQTTEQQIDLKIKIKIVGSHGCYHSGSRQGSKGKNPIVLGRDCELAKGLGVLDGAASAKKKKVKTVLVTLIQTWDHKQISGAVQ